MTTCLAGSTIFKNGVKEISVTSVQGPVPQIRSMRVAAIFPLAILFLLQLAYAQPPVGELRWHETVPAKSWTGVRDAAAFGAPCAQPVLGDWNKHDAETSKEDCLFLNVITPVWP